MEQGFVGFMAFIDCTKLPIPGPKVVRERASSTQVRRKSTCIVKNLYTAHRKGLLIFKTKCRQLGSKRNYKVYKKYHPKLQME